MLDNAKPKYDESSIKPLDGIEHIRRHPQMYIGGTDKKALHHLIAEVMDLGIDEAFAGNCSQIDIMICPGEEIRITDNSEGLLVSMYSHRDPPVSALELQMTTIGCGVSYPTRYWVQGGLHGVGLSAVNALCADMVAQVRRDGFLWQQRYQVGKAVSPLEQVRPLENDEPTGNTFIFTPDFTIMERNSFDFDLIAARCRDVAHTIAGLRLTVRDERVSPAREQVFHAPEGIRARLVEMQAQSSTTSDAFYRVVKVETWADQRYPNLFQVEIVFQYSDTKHTHIESFVNTIAMMGGTHIDGFRRGLRANLPKHDVPDEAIEQGLTAVINVFRNRPAFESQTRIVLLNPEIGANVGWVVSEMFRTTYEASQKLIEYLKSRQT